MTTRFAKIGASIIAVTIALGTPALAQNTMVGGAEMLPSRNIIENAVNSADHTTLVAAVQAAGLVETLSGPGPFTVFAPTNAAFEKLPDGTVEDLQLLYGVGRELAGSNAWPNWYKGNPFKANRDAMKKATTSP